MNSILEKINDSIVSKIVRQAEDEEIINLARNPVELFTPDSLLRGAQEAIEGGLNGYQPGEGRKNLRKKVTDLLQRETGVQYNPEKEVLITCGATEGFLSTMFSLVEGENGVVIPEPYKENYLPVVKLSRGKPLFLQLNEPDYTFHFTDFQNLPNYRVFVMNNPHNPTGKVFNEKEINVISEAIIERDAFLILDESFKYLNYKEEFNSPVSIEGMRDRVVIIGSFSPVLSISGWRIGYVVGSEDVIQAIKKVHYYGVHAAPAPFQWACENFELSPGYIKRITDKYQEKRDDLCSTLEKTGFKFFLPEGGYYVFANFEDIWEGNDWGFYKYLLKNKKIACIPGSTFYNDRDRGNNKVRFTFSQSEFYLNEVSSILKAGIR